MSYLKVEGHQGLVKDPDTGIVLNTNNNELAAAKARKEKRKQKEQEFEELKTDVQELKSMLKTIIEKL